MLRGMPGTTPLTVGDTVGVMDTVPTSLTPGVAPVGLAPGDYRLLTLDMITPLLMGVCRRYTDYALI